MTSPSRPARLGLLRPVLMGCALRLPLAIIALVVVVSTGYPGWARTIWQLTVILAGIVLGMSVAYWLIAYAVWYGTQAGFENKRAMPSYAFFLVRPVIVATVTLGILAAVLTAALMWGAGESQL